MRARARFCRSSRRWRWCPVCRANWRLSNVAAPYRLCLRRRLRVRARGVHPAAIRVEHGTGRRAAADCGRHDASSSTRRRAPGTTGGAPKIPVSRCGIFGIALILGIGIALSRNRGAISWRVVAWGVGLQLAFAIFVLLVPLGQRLFRTLGDAITKMLGFSYVGSEFVFGEIGKQHSSLGLIFAFQVLPAIIFVSALFAILYYLGVMQLVVKAFAVL